MSGRGKLVALRQRGSSPLWRLGWAGLALLTLNLGAAPMLNLPSAQGADATPIVLATITVPVSEGIQSIDVNQMSNRVYVANQQLTTVSAIDGVTNAVVGSVAVGTSPHGVAVNPTTNRIYVLVGTLGNVTTFALWAFDGATNTVLGTLSMSGFPASSIDVNPVTDRVYVTGVADFPPVGVIPAVWVIDGTTLNVITKIPIFGGGQAAALAVNSVTNRIYVNSPDPYFVFSSTVKVIDGYSNSVIASIGYLGGIPVDIALNPVTNRVYVTAFNPLVSPPIGHVVVIDGATNSGVTAIGVTETCSWGARCGIGEGLGVNPTTNRIYVAVASWQTGIPDKIKIINGASDAIVAEVVVGPHPFSVGVNPATDRVYVTHKASPNFVSVIGEADQPPAVTISFTPDGSNGWFKTTPATGSVAATDDLQIASIACTDSLSGLSQGTLVGGGTPSASRTLSVSGQAIHEISCTATDAGGNTAAAAATVKLDATPPVISGSRSPAPNANGWNNTDVTAVFTCSDAVSGVADSPSPAVLSSDGAGQSATRTCTDVAGNQASATVSRINIDKTKPTITIASPTNNEIDILNVAAAASYTCADTLSGLVSCTGTVPSGTAFDTTSVTSKTFTVAAGDRAGNQATASNIYRVQYAPAGTTCLGAPCHAILQPINTDGSSVFKQGSTIPAKFRVSDANGVSIGTPGVVSAFNLVQRISGTTVQEVNEEVVSTTPDTAFRWSATDQLWIFNINTKELSGGQTYVYRIMLNDGTAIEFRFGLR